MQQAFLTAFQSGNEIIFAYFSVNEYLEGVPKGQAVREYRYSQAVIFNFIDVTIR